MTNRLAKVSLRQALLFLVANMWQKQFEKRKSLPTYDWFGEGNYHFLARKDISTYICCIGSFARCCSNQFRYIWGLELDYSSKSYLLNQFLRPTFGISSLFWVPHLETCEIENSIVPWQHPCNGSISISIFQIVISWSKFCSMIIRFIPPVYSGYLFWN